MKIKRSLFSFIILCTLFLCACQQNEVDYTQWIPDHDISELNLNDEKITSYKYRAIPDKSVYTSIDEIAKKLLNHEDVSELIYKNQIINGECLDLSEAIAEKRTIIYVSSSEGNNLNDGRTPETAKKTFDGMSGAAGIAVLLKCGDTFDMKDMFYVGDNTVFCSYGEGPRPILDFTKPIEEQFVNIRGYENVWAVDLSRTEFNKERSEKGNCNFGQLYLDGECNWNRFVVPTAEVALYDFPQAISERKDNCWAVDWMHGVLYLYSEVNPNEHEVRIATGRHGLNFKEVRNSIVSDLEIFGVGVCGCVVNSSTDVSIQNCYFKNLGGAVSESGIRYGNGIQIGNFASNVSIKNNIFDGVYDSGYSDKGLSVTDRQENIIVTGNIFSHCYCGIEQFDDYSCITPISNLVISNNLIYETCDITNPIQTMYSDERGILTNGVTDYFTYRNRNPYEKIAAAIISPMQEEGAFDFSGNVLWQTNRFLVCVNSDYGVPNIKDNFFFSLIDSDRDCLYTNIVTNVDTGEEQMTFLKKMFEEENGESLTINEVTDTDASVKTVDYSRISGEDIAKLKQVLKAIVGEQ